MFEQRTVRISAIGDELLAGVGDPRALGWFGRVIARTPTEDLDLAAYTLAAPQEGTEALAARWQDEVGRRFEDGAENRLVVGLAAHDLDVEVSSARSRLNLANIIDGASQQGIPVVVVGPPPGLDPVRNRRLADLSAAFADVTTRRRHIYVDTFTPLQHHEQWRADLAANDGRPGQAGYGLLAWLVLHRGWYEWMRLPVPA